VDVLFSLTADAVTGASGDIPTNTFINLMNTNDQSLYAFPYPLEKAIITYPDGRGSITVTRLNVDECTASTTWQQTCKGVEALCVDTPSGFICSCPAGRAGDATIACSAVCTVELETKGSSVSTGAFIAAVAAYVKVSPSSVYILSNVVKAGDTSVTVVEFVMFTNDGHEDAAADAMMASAAKSGNTVPFAGYKAVSFQAAGQPTYKSAGRLSYGASVGIGIACAVVGLCILGSLAYYCVTGSLPGCGKKKKQPATKEVEQGNSSKSGSDNSSDSS